MTGRRAGWLLALGMLGAPSAARAQSSGEAATVAEALFREGVDLFDAGRTREACDKFVESFRLDPANGTLLNVALCHERDGKTASAWAEFSQLAGRAAQAGQKEREQLARQRAADLERRVARVQLDFPRGSNVTRVDVDGQALGRAAWSTPLPVDPGEHTFAFGAPGSVGVVRRVTVGRDLNVSLVVPVLEPVPAPILEPSAPPARSEARVKDHTLAYGVGAGGVVALGLGTYFGLRAIAKKSDVDAHCAGGFCDTEGMALDDEAHTSATLATIAFGAGLAAVGAAVALYVWSPSRPASRAALRIAPAVGLRTGGVRLEATW